jgi:hypothetical protein
MQISSYLWGDMFKQPLAHMLHGTPFSSTTHTTEDSTEKKTGMFPAG